MCLRGSIDDNKFGKMKAPNAHSEQRKQSMVPVATTSSRTFNCIHRIDYNFSLLDRIGGGVGDVGDGGGGNLKSVNIEMHSHFDSIP